MNDYIIETHDLTKKYGSQTSVSHLNAAHYCSDKQT